MSKRFQSRRGFLGTSLLLGATPFLSFRSSEVLTTEKKETREGFSELIPHSGNFFATRLVREVAETFHKPVMNPLLITSEVGNGKTAIITDFVDYMSRVHPKARVKSVSGFSFFFDYINAVRKGDTQLIEHEYLTPDILIIDGMNEVGYSFFTQEEIINLIRARIDSGRQLIIAQLYGPTVFCKLTPELRSLIGAGVRANVVMPEGSEKLKVIKILATRRGLELDDDTCQLIAEQRVKSFRAMSSNILRLKLAAEVAGHGPTFAFATEFFRS